MLQSDFQFDLQKILEGDNIGIAATGITIVFVALLLITIAIALLPKVLRSLEGILPALEPSHALAYVGKIAPELGNDHLLVINLCGRGDKDVFTVADVLGANL